MADPIVYRAKRGLLLFNFMLVLGLGSIGLLCIVMWPHDMGFGDKLKIMALGLLLLWASIQTLKKEVLPFATRKLAITLFDDYLELGTIKGPLHLPRSALSGCGQPAPKNKFLVSRDQKNLIEIKLKKAHKLRNWRGQPVNPVFHGGIVSGETPNGIIRTIREWRKNGLGST